MERETDRALVMPLPHPMDVARAGGTDEGGALCNYGVSFGQGEAKPPRDARSGHRGDCAVRAVAAAADLGGSLVAWSPQTEDGNILPAA